MSSGREDWESLGSYLKRKAPRILLTLVIVIFSLLLIVFIGSSLLRFFSESVKEKSNNNSTSNINIPPEILSVQLTDVTANNAIVRWVTKKKTTGVVIYCKAAYGGGDVCLPSENKTLSLDHSVFLKGLDTNTSYDIKIQCTDEQENQVILEIKEFLKTSTLKDDKNLEIINILTPNITPTNISFSWDTNKPAACSFIYWSDPLDIHTLPSNSDSTKHYVIIKSSDILPKKTVNYYIMAMDSTGNLCISNISNFKSK
jgi:hypothetical protein